MNTISTQNNAEFYSFDWPSEDAQGEEPKPVVDKRPVYPGVGHAKSQKQSDKKVMLVRSANKVPTNKNGKIIIEYEEVQIPEEESQAFMQEKEEVKDGSSKTGSGKARSGKSGSGKTESGQGGSGQNDPTKIKSSPKDIFELVKPFDQLLEEESVNEGISIRVDTGADVEEVSNEETQEEALELKQQEEEHRLQDLLQSNCSTIKKDDLMTTPLAEGQINEPLQKQSEFSLDPKEATCSSIPRISKKLAELNKQTIQLSDLSSGRRLNMPLPIGCSNFKNMMVPQSFEKMLNKRAIPGDRLGLSTLKSDFSASTSKQGPGILDSEKSKNPLNQGFLVSQYQDLQQENSLLLNMTQLSESIHSGWTPDEQKANLAQKQLLTHKSNYEKKEALFVQRIQQMEVEMNEMKEQSENMRRINERLMRLFDKKSATKSSKSRQSSRPSAAHSRRPSITHSKQNIEFVIDESTLRQGLQRSEINESIITPRDASSTPAHPMSSYHKRSRSKHHRRVTPNRVKNIKDQLESHRVREEDLRKLPKFPIEMGQRNQVMESATIPEATNEVSIAQHTDPKQLQASTRELKSELVFSIEQAPTEEEEMPRMLIQTQAGSSVGVPNECRSSEELLNHHQVHPLAMNQIPVGHEAPPTPTLLIGNETSRRLDNANPLSEVDPSSPSGEQRDHSVFSAKQIDSSVQLHQSNQPMSQPQSPEIVMSLGYLPPAGGNQIEIYDQGEAESSDYSVPSSELCDRLDTIRQCANCSFIFAQQEKKLTRKIDECQQSLDNVLNENQVLVENVNALNVQLMQERDRSQRLQVDLHQEMQMGHQVQQAHQEARHQLQILMGTPEGASKELQLLAHSLLGRQRIQLVSGEVVIPVGEEELLSVLQLDQGEVVETTLTSESTTEGTSTEIREIQNQFEAALSRLQDYKPKKKNESRQSKSPRGAHCSKCCQYHRQVSEMQDTLKELLEIKTQASFGGGRHPTGHTDHSFQSTSQSQLNHMFSQRTEMLKPAPFRKAPPTPCSRCGNFSKQSKMSTGKEEATENKSSICCSQVPSKPSKATEIARKRPGSQITPSPQLFYAPTAEATTPKEVPKHEAKLKLKTENEVLKKITTDRNQKRLSPPPPSQTSTLMQSQIHQRMKPTHNHHPTMIVQKRAQTSFEMMRSPQGAPETSNRLYLEKGGQTIESETYDRVHQSHEEIPRPEHLPQHAAVRRSPPNAPSGSTQARPGSKTKGTSRSSKVKPISSSTVNGMSYGFGQGLQTPAEKHKNEEEALSSCRAQLQKQLAFQPKLRQDEALRQSHQHSKPVKQVKEVKEVKEVKREKKFNKTHRVSLNLMEEEDRSRNDFSKTGSNLQDTGERSSQSFHVEQLDKVRQMRRQRSKKSPLVEYPRSAMDYHYLANQLDTHIEAEEMKAERPRKRDHLATALIQSENLGSIAEKGRPNSYLEQKFSERAQSSLNTSKGVVYERHGSVQMAYAKSSLKGSSNEKTSVKGKVSQNSSIQTGKTAEDKLTTKSGGGFRLPLKTSTARHSLDGNFQELNFYQASHRSNHQESQWVEKSSQSGLVLDRYPESQVESTGTLRVNHDAPVGRHEYTDNKSELLSNPVPSSEMVRSSETRLMHEGASSGFQQPQFSQVISGPISKSYSSSHRSSTVTLGDQGKAQFYGQMVRQNMPENQVPNPQFEYQQVEQLPLSAMERPFVEDQVILSQTTSNTSGIHEMKHYSNYLPSPSSDSVMQGTPVVQRQPVGSYFLQGQQQMVERKAMGPATTVLQQTLAPFQMLNTQAPHLALQHQHHQQQHHQHHQQQQQQFQIQPSAQTQRRSRKSPFQPLPVVQNQQSSEQKQQEFSNYNSYLQHQYMKEMINERERTSTQAKSYRVGQPAQQSRQNKENFQRIPQ